MVELFQLQSSLDNSDLEGNINRSDLKMFRVIEVQVISTRLYKCIISI